MQRNRTVVNADERWQEIVMRARDEGRLGAACRQVASANDTDINQKAFLGLTNSMIVMVRILRSKKNDQLSI
jgi:hypothetical protein